MRLSLAFALLLGGHSQADAYITFGFSLEDCAWEATDIVVVTEGDVIDGKVRILETWKGGLKVSKDLSVPELAVFAPDAMRTVQTSLWPQKGSAERPVRVTGARMILFLKKTANDPGRWRPGSWTDDMALSVVWVDRGTTYAFMPDLYMRSAMVWGMSVTEDKLKAETADIGRTRDSVDKAASLKDPAERVRSLRPFLNSTRYQARRLAFDELGKCGEAALPLLREMLAVEAAARHNDITDMLADGAAATRHNDIIEALGKAGGVTVGPDLTRVVEVETAFFERIGPALKPGWWNSLAGPEVEAYRRRYGRLYAALYTLRSIRFAGCKPVVTRLRDYWRSLPQLDDPSGLKQISEECDHILRELAAAGK